MTVYGSIGISCVILQRLMIPVGHTFIKQVFSISLKNSEERRKGREIKEKILGMKGTIDTYLSNLLTLNLGKQLLQRSWTIWMRHYLNWNKNSFFLILHPLPLPFSCLHVFMTVIIERKVVSNFSFCSYLNPCYIWVNFLSPHCLKSAHFVIL